MKYSEEFKKCIKEELPNQTFIGLGNPSAKIIIVGKEVSTNPNSEDPLQKQGLISYKRNVLDWNFNVENGIKLEDIKDWVIDKDLDLNKVENNPLYAFKGTIKRYTSNTWKNYQKLYDIIFQNEMNFDNQKVLDFQKEFFITEMSDFPASKTKDAQKQETFRKKLEERKNTFFKSEFIQNFPVVVLACSNYIWNNEKDRQIDKIFGVTYDLNKKYSKGVYDEFSKSNRFWTHYSEDGKKLVIHTRQLSNNVKNEMLNAMGTLIKQHLAKLDQ